MDVAGRLDRLRPALAAARCDALLVTNLTNVRYLTGFTGSAGALLVLPDRAVLVTDGRYEERATAETAAAETEVDLAIARTVDEQSTVLETALGSRRRLGLEAEHVSWADQRRFAEEWLPAAELVATGSLVEVLRAVKDAGELARIEAAAGIADAALAGCRGMLDERPTETAFAVAIEAEMRRLGAAGAAFPTIVASGPNGARPHHEPSSRVIEPGDLVTIDFGALVDGYRSDMTRTIPVGGWDRVDDARRRLVDVVRSAQEAGVAAVRAGARAADVDRAARDVIAGAGWADAFVHGTGHGVGLDIHEDPKVSATSPATLVAGHVVTVEPGVYLPGAVGARVEDTVVVDPGGCRAVTRAPKD